MGYSLGSGFVPSVSPGLLSYLFFEMTELGHLYIIFKPKLCNSRITVRIYQKKKKKKKDELRSCLNFFHFEKFNLFCHNKMHVQLKLWLY